MEKKRFEVGGRAVRLLGARSPELLFLQPVDAHDLAELDGEFDRIAAGTGRRIALAAIEVRDWNRELSPWEAPPVFGNERFGSGAAETLGFLTETLIPALPPADKLCVGGYSLAGLFALWAGYQTGLFAGVNAASPSVWFPGWTAYIRARPPKARHIYLSLGDREERTRNPVMAGVGNAIREQYELIKPAANATLEWNGGGHFRDSGPRTAKGFLWLAGQI